MTQKQSLVKEEFYNMVKKDFETIGEALDEAEIAAKSNDKHKSNIKSKIRKATLQYLKEKQLGHSKVRDIQYDKLKTQ